MGRWGVRKLARLLGLAVVAMALLVSAASAAKVALVVGNGRYEHTGELANPGNDAKAFAAFLRTAGYDVTEVIDGDRRAMSESLAAFAGKLQPDDTALFYYAGHGLQMAGENYLIGVEARLLSEFDVPGEAISLSSIIETMETRAKVAMLFIDACRDNPLADNLKQSTRSVSRGLAPVDTQGDGTVIAFAAEPGQVALDGEGDNSPFTSALIDNLATPGAEIATAFRHVVADVRSATGGRQSPQLVTSLAIEIYFGEAGDSAAQDFDRAERVGTIAGWQVFLREHPEGFYADLARVALEDLLKLASVRTAVKAGSSGLEASLDFPLSGKIVDVELNFAFTTDCEKDHVAHITSPTGRRINVMVRGLGRCGHESYTSHNSEPAFVAAFQGAEAEGIWRFVMTDITADDNRGSLDALSLNVAVSNDGVITNHTVTLDGLPVVIPDGR
jgi:subtilisin-like proprotein convertase family protein